MKNIFQKVALFLLPTLFLIIACSEKEVIPKSSAKVITKFRFIQFSPAIEGVIDETTKRITAVVPPSTDVTKLIPSISVSAKAKVLPDSGKIQDFTNEVAYTVTAEDGTVATYKAMVSRTKFSGKDILEFSFADFTPAIVAKIDPATKTITATLPATADLTKLKPTLKLSDRAIISPATGVVTDFSKPVNFTVTAEDGMTQVYVATINIEDTKSSTVIYCDNKFCRAFNAKTGKVKWAYPIEEQFVASSPTYDKGRVYFGTLGNGSPSRLICLDVTTGNKIWDLKVKGNTVASPMVTDDVIYFSSIYYNSTTNSPISVIYAVNAINGSVKWQYSLSSYSDSSPLIHKGFLYLVGENGLLILDIKDGNKVSNSLQSGLFVDNISPKTKSSKIQGISFLNSSPAVSDGFIYFGYGQSSISAFNVVSKKVEWTMKIPTPNSYSLIASSPTIDNNNLYINGLGKLYSIDLTNKAIRWNYVMEQYGDISTSPIVNQNLVYSVQYQKELFAIDIISGKKRWSIVLPIVTSPVYADSFIYVAAAATGNDSDKLYALDAETGIVKWSYPLEGVGIGAAPSALVIDENGKVYHSGISGAQN